MNGIEAVSSLGSEVSYSGVLVAQRTLNRYSLYSQKDNTLTTYNPFFDKDSASLVGGNMPHFSSAQRGLFFSGGTPYLAQMILDDTHISLPGYNYFDTEIRFAFNQLRNLPVVNKLQVYLKEVLTKDHYFFEDEFKTMLKRKRKGLRDSEVDDIYRCYFAGFSFDHLLLHDFAHLMEPENQQTRDIFMSPYHVYQFFKINLSVLQSQQSQGSINTQEALKIANNCRFYRIAFTKSLKNELLVSNFQHTLTTSDSIAEHIETTRQHAETLNKLDTATGYVFIDMSKQVNDMLIKTLGSDYSEIDRCATLITQSCRNTSQSILEITNDIKTKGYGGIKLNLQMYCNLLSMHFGVPPSSYEKGKHQNYYYYFHDCISHIMKREISRVCQKEYEYLYARNHNTHLLLVFDDTDEGMKQLLMLYKFIDGLFDQLSSYK